MLDDDTVDEEATRESIQEENIDNSIIQAAIEMLDDDVDEQVELDVVDAEVESLTEATIEEEKEPEVESEQEEAKVDAAAEALELVEATEDAEMEPFTAVEIISETTEVEPFETEATFEEVTADLEAISDENTSTQQWPSDIAIELTALPAEHEAGNELLQGLNKVLTKHNTKTHFSDTKQELNEAMTNEPIFTHLATEDYFLQQGIKISNDLPADITEISPALAEQRLAEIILNDEHSSEEEKNKALMVMMSFTDWLLHFKNKKEENATTIEDKRHIKSMWQKEKLAAALEEEDDEIPEEVFEMAVNSITQEDDLASESLAEIYLQQGKHDKAIEMYKKLSLRNPEKNAYFALKIKDIIKEK
jgi:tetratricopeptide (TPR) repeat protein